jgi:hypothetical protein
MRAGARPRAQRTAHTFFRLSPSAARSLGLYRRGRGAAARHAALAELLASVAAVIAADDRLAPVKVIGLAANFGLLRAFASLLASVVVFTANLLRTQLS